VSPLFPGGLVKMIILGTAHDFQRNDPRLKTLISELVIREKVAVIAEENRPLSPTIAREVAESMHLR
jgi:hypothetical protein